jgi:hypothetical protein
VGVLFGTDCAGSKERKLLFKDDKIAAGPLFTNILILVMIKMYMMIDDTYKAESYVINLHVNKN